MKKVVYMIEVTEEDFDNIETAVYEKFVRTLRKDIHDYSNEVAHRVLSGKEIKPQSIWSKIFNRKEKS